MIISPSELEDQLFRCCPDGFLEETVRAVWAGYRTLDRDCERFESPEREYMRGHTRRANIEGRWRRAATRFPALKVAVRQNKKKSAHYTLVAAGRLRLTASAVATPGVLPRDAIFRTNLSSAQLNLLGPNPLLPRRRALYAIVTHGWGRDLCSPGFVSVAFPASDYRSVLHTVSLRLRFPDLWAEEEARQALVPLSDLQHSLFSPGVIDDYGEPVTESVAQDEERIEENFKLDLKRREEEEKEKS